MSWQQPQLPNGLGTNFAVPNILVQSSMFSSLASTGRTSRPPIETPRQVSSLGGTNIIQSAGQQLDQSDADLLFELIRQTLISPTPEEPILVNAAQLCNVLKKTRGGHTSKLLMGSLARLAEASFIAGTTSVAKRPLRLIQSMGLATDSSAKRNLFEVHLDPALGDFYANSQWALIRADERAKLRRSSLARWLHAFYASHKQPHPMLVSTMKDLTGQSSAQQSKWLSSLDKALATVKTVTGWSSCERSGEKVLVVKKAKV